MKLLKRIAALLFFGTVSVSAQEYWFQHLQVITNAMSYDAADAQFLGAGNKTIWYSPDGALWSGHLVDGVHQDVVRANGRYVAVGSTSASKKQISVSDDSFAWTPIFFNETGTFNGITFALGNFWAVGDNGDVRRSSDGLVWTPVTIPAEYDNVDLRSIVFENGLLLVTGATGKLLTSTDGITWATFTVPTTSRIMAVTFGNGVYMLGTEAGSVFSSPTGTTWSLRAILTFAVKRMGYTAGNGGFFIATGEYESIAASPTGAVWDTIQQETFWPIINSLNSLAFGEGIFVTNSTNGSLYQIPDPYSGYTYYPSGLWKMNSMAFGNGTYLSVGDAYAMAQWDGVGGWDIDLPIFKPTEKDHYSDIDFSSATGVFWVGGYDYLEAFANLPFNRVGQRISLAAYYDTRTADEIAANSPEDTDFMPITAVATGGGYVLALSRLADSDGDINGGYALWSEATLGSDPATAISYAVPLGRRYVWNDAVYGEDSIGNPIFIAVGEAGLIHRFYPLSSGDPEERPSGTADELVDVTYVDDSGAGNKGFYAVSNTGVITHSADGQYWRSLRISNIAEEVPTAIRYGNEQLVVVCASGAIFSTTVADGASTGGINPTWIKRGSPVPFVEESSETAPLLKGLAYGDNQFASIGFGVAISSYPVNATPIVLPPIIVAEDTASGKVGTAFTFEFEVFNESQPATLAGEIPPGLTLSGNTISGTPTTAGVFDLQITAQGDGGTSAIKSVLVTIAAASGTVPDDPDDPEVTPTPEPASPPSTPAAVEITSASTVRAKVNKQFSYTLNASGPVQTYQVGKLPFGLRRSGNRIVGRPKAAGTYYVNIKAIGASSSDSLRLKIVVRR